MYWSVSADLFRTDEDGVAGATVVLRTGGFDDGGVVHVISPLLWVHRLFPSENNRRV